MAGSRGALMWLLAKDIMHMDREIEHVRSQTESSIPSFEERDEQLLPGLPNALTLEHITTKLPWQAILRLSEVSCGWQAAVRSRRIYNARVLSQSTEALVVINCMSLARYGPPHVLAIGVFSLNDRSFHRLPAIPGQVVGIPDGCRCTCSDGKIYVLGGTKRDPIRDVKLPVRTVYVMDLAGQRKWERCADMNIPRECFGCGVVNGNIYVCGGREPLSWRPVHRAEVYDPKRDTWSEIRALPKKRIDPLMTAMGDELLVHGGERSNDPEINGRYPMAYHPVKDHWRMLCLGESWLTHAGDEATFVAQGKIHQMNVYGIDVYDDDENSWTRKHRIAWGKISKNVYLQQADQWTTLPVDDELVMLMHGSQEVYSDEEEEEDAARKKWVLHTSTGFGDTSKTILEWDAECIIPGKRHFQISHVPFMALVRL